MTSIAGLYQIRKRVAAGTQVFDSAICDIDTTFHTIVLTQGSAMDLASSTENNQDLPSADSLPYTITQDNDVTVVTFTSGPREGEILQINIEQLRSGQPRGLAQSSDAQSEALTREDTPEEDLPPTSCHGFGQQISEEEYEALVALETYHTAHGTLHLLYPDVYSPGYVLRHNESDDDMGRDNDDDEQERIRRESVEQNFRRDGALTVVETLE